MHCFMLGIPIPGSAACSFWCISRLAHVVKLYTDAAFHSNKFLHSDKEIVAGPVREGQGFSVATTPRLSAVNVGDNRGHGSCVTTSPYGRPKVQ